VPDKTVHKILFYLLYIHIYIYIKREREEELSIYLVISVIVYSYILLLSEMEAQVLPVPHTHVSSCCGIPYSARECRSDEFRKDHFSRADTAGDV